MTDNQNKNENNISNENESAMNKEEGKEIING